MCAARAMILSRRGRVAVTKFFKQSSCPFTNPIEPLLRLVLDTFTHDIVRDRSQELRADVFQLEARARRSSDGALGHNLLASQLRFVVRFVVRRTTGDEILTASGVLHVLDAHMDALTSDTTTDGLVNLHTHRTRGHVPHDPSSPLVLHVGHTLLLRRVHLDVDVVTHTERTQVRRGVERAVLAVTAGKHLAGAMA